MAFEATIRFVSEGQAPKVTRRTAYSEETERVKAAVEKWKVGKVLVQTVEEGSKLSPGTLARHVRAALDARRFEVGRVREQIVVIRKREARQKKVERRKPRKQVKMPEVKAPE